MEKRVTGLGWKKPEKEDWHIKKKEGPDMGSYDPSKSMKTIEKKVGNTLFSKVFNTFFDFNSRMFQISLRNTLRKRPLCLHVELTKQTNV